jgi:hypothetical protein
LIEIIDELIGKMERDPVTPNRLRALESSIIDPALSNLNQAA